MRNSMNKAIPFGQTKVPQPASTSSLQVEQLALLDSSRQPRVAQVDVQHVKSLPSLRRAINYALSHADMDPKEAYGPLQMDKGTWSRISNGQQSFPADELLKLRAVTQNDIPLIWLAHSMGYELRPLRSELQEQLEAERARADELERQNALMRELLTGRK